MCLGLPEGFDALFGGGPGVPHTDVGLRHREQEAGLGAVPHTHHIVGVAAEWGSLLARVQVPDFGCSVWKNKTI